MINSKKAIVATIVAILIIAIISGAVVLVIFTQISKSIGAESTFSDTMCRMNAYLVHKSQLPIWLFCSEKKITLDATDWDSCPNTKENVSENIKANKITDDMIKQCASEQLANLAMRCWYMYGRDKWNFVGSVVGWDYPCFKIKFNSHLRTNYLTEKSVTKQLDCDYLPNNDCDPDCGKKDAIYWESHESGPCKLQVGEEWTIKYRDAKSLINDQVIFQEVEDSFTCHD